MLVLEIAIGVFIGIFILPIAVTFAIRSTAAIPWKSVGRVIGGTAIAVFALYVILETAVKLF